MPYDPFKSSVGSCSGLYWVAVLPTLTRREPDHPPPRDPDKTPLWRRALGALRKAASAALGWRLLIASGAPSPSRGGVSPLATLRQRPRLDLPASSRGRRRRRFLRHAR